MKLNNKRGISLIVLVITIIVMIILAATIILSLSSSGIIGSANEATFKTDVKAIQSELSVKISDVMLKDEEDTLEGVAAETILESAVKHAGKFVISNQKLMYNGSEVTADEKVYLEQIGIEEYWNNSQVYLFEIDENGALTGIDADYIGDGGHIYADKEHKQEITEIVIPTGVTSIGECVFEEYGYITKVKIPTGVTDIGYAAFDYCDSLVDINIPDTVTSIGDNAFTGCTSLTSVTIPSTSISLGEGVFSSCTSLTSVSIPTAVVSIGEYMFNDCINLETVSIPGGVTSIGNYAFHSCVNLTDITIISKGLTKIGDFAFFSCDSLKNIIIPDGVTEIGEYAFQHSGLVSITLPKSLTKIGYGVFYDGSAGYDVTLKDVYFKGTETEWNSIQKGKDNQQLNYATIHYEVQ